MATLTTLQLTDTLANSRVPINNNFSALNSAKVEGASALTTAGKLVKVTAAGIVGESIISESGTAITVSGTMTVTGLITGSISGNAGTVTNGVYTSGSYADPAWLTSLAKSKVGLGSVENTALSTWAGSANITTLGTITAGSFPWANISSKPTFASANTASAVVQRDSSGNFSAGTITAALNGNASTVTNGVYTSGSYADPSWITSLDKSKVGLGSVENTALSTWAGSANITYIGTATAGGSLTFPNSSGVVLKTAAGTGLIALYRDAGDDVIVRNSAASGSIAFQTEASPTTKMWVRSNGNILIGTGSDNGAKLQVAGQVAAEGAGGGAFYAGSTASQYLLSTTLSGGTSNGNYGLYWDKTSEAIEIWAASIRRARFFGTGAVQFAGTVESASGGFKFPDGQTQAVAMQTKHCYRTLGLTIDGGGSAITTGSKGYIYVPFDCTLDNWTVLGDQTGSIVIDVKRSTYAGFPTTSSIVGAGNKPTLSSAQKNQATPSSWTSTSLSAGDVIEFTVDSAATLTRASISLRVTV